MEYENIDIEEIMGFPTDEWTTLASIKRIGLYSNNYIFTDPFSIQFYIDSAAGVIFVRYTDGKPIELLSDKNLLNGYVSVEVNNHKYQVKLIGGGITDSKVGVFHDVYGTDNISGFFR